MKENNIKIIVDRIGRSRDKLLPILQEICARNKYISRSNLHDVAEEMDLSAAEVYGVATFYSFLSLRKRGDNVIKVCKTISCDMKSRRRVLDTIKKVLKIDLNETTSNNKFTLEETNCIGLCNKSPAILINDKEYTEVTPGKIKDILSVY